MPREGGDPGLELTAYAEGPAGEAWALAMKLFFSSGKPRFVAVGQELDLSPPQGHALCLLVTPRPMGELARLMHCDNSNITGIIDRLEERGLVERRSDQQDRRVRRIGLTPDGERIRERLFRAMAQPPEALERLPLADQRSGQQHVVGIGREAHDHARRLAGAGGAEPAASPTAASPARGLRRAVGE